MRAFILIDLLMAAIFISCESSSINNASPFKNDTTEVIKFAIKESFYHKSLPEIDHLTQKYYFKDSILFATDSLPLEILPDKIDSLKFKILSRGQICDLITSDSNQSNQPNYLYVSNFKKNDSVYYVNISSLSCVPFGGGGVCGIDIVKRNDSLFVLHKGFSNIN